MHTCKICDPSISLCSILARNASQCLAANRMMSSEMTGDRVLLVDDDAVRGRDCGCGCNAGVEGADIEVRDGEDTGEEEGVDRIGGLQDIITVGRS